MRQRRVKHAEVAFKPLSLPFLRWLRKDCTMIRRLVTLSAKEHSTVMGPHRRRRDQQSEKAPLRVGGRESPLQRYMRHARIWTRPQGGGNAP